MLSLFVRVIHAPLYETGMPQASRTKKRIGTQVLSEVTPESCVLSASILLEQNVSLRMPLFLFSQWFNMIVTCCYNCFVSITCNFTGVFLADIGSPVLLYRRCVPLSLFLVTILMEPNTVKILTFQLLCGHEFTITNHPTFLLIYYFAIVIHIFWFFFFWSSVISLDINTRGLKFAFVTLD